MIVALKTDEEVRAPEWIKARISISIFPPDTLGIIREENLGPFFGVTDTVNRDGAGQYTATWTFAMPPSTALALQIDVDAFAFQHLLILGDSAYEPADCIEQAIVPLVQGVQNPLAPEDSTEVAIVVQEGVFPADHQDDVHLVETPVARRKDQHLGSGMAKDE